jgi:glycosyltransferase involved in cell wall biosynthesis
MNKKNIHITHIVSTYPPYKGGMGNVAWQMVHELAKKGHETRVLTPALNGGYLTDAEESIIRIEPTFSFRNSAFVPKMYAWLKKTDVIHLHYPFYGGAELVALYRLFHRKKPIVISYHMDVEGKGMLKSFFLAYRYLIAPSVLSRADKIIVSSMDYAHESLYLHRHMDKVMELPFGIPEEFSRPIEIRRGKIEDPLKLVFVAALDSSHYFKGLENLLKAIASVKSKQKIELAIIGEGDMRGFYESEVKTLGIKSLVTFKGKVSDEDLKKTYHWGDITVLPSIDRSESFGLVLAESMACGTPVIASELPGVRSLVSQSQTGVLVKPNDVDDLAKAILYMGNNRPRLKRMGENASFAIEENHRWPVIIDKLEALYLELLQKYENNTNK